MINILMVPSDYEMEIGDIFFHTIFSKLYQTIE